MDINFMNGAISMNSSISAESRLSGAGRAGNISDLLSSGNSYTPDHRELKTGMTFSLSDWSSEKKDAFRNLSLDEIHKQVDLTKTTRSEAYEVIRALVQEGKISEKAEGLTMAMGLDQNLDNDAEFNLFEYLEKSMNGFDQDTPAAHRDIFASALRGLTRFHNGDDANRIVDTYV